MRRIAFLSALAAVATSLAVTVVVSADSASTSRHTRKLEYLVRIPITGPHGSTQGSVHVIAGDAFDRTGTTKVGTHQGVCTVTVTAQRMQCVSTTEIAGRGQIVAEGATAMGGAGVIPVVGGTGSFQSKRGIRTLVTLPRQGNVITARVIFRITR